MENRCVLVPPSPSLCITCWHYKWYIGLDGGSLTRRSKARLCGRTESQANGLTTGIKGSPALAFTVFHVEHAQGLD